MEVKIEEKNEEIFEKDIKEKKTTKKSKTSMYIIICLAIAIIGASIYITNRKFKYIEKFELRYIKSGLTVENIIAKNSEINVTLGKTLLKKDRWCQVINEEENINSDKWIKVENNNCILSINNDSKYIVVKDEKNIGIKKPLSNYINSIISLNFDVNKIFLVQGEKKEISVDLQYVGLPDKTLTYKVENEEIISVQNNIIEGLKAGETTLSILDKYGHKAEISIIVTDLISLPEINTKKEFLTAEKYTEEEAHLLDDILEERVDNAGLKTRAGVVAAARFITLEFKYKIPYFLENGRFQKTDFSEQIDGEGRYYHKGLYLSKDKYETIRKSKTKPVMWGGTLYEYSNSRYMKNGLDCSGFVTWALVNGGYDPGDIGAGPGEWYTTLPDLGVSYPITLNLLKSGKVKAGDLIGWNGHIGIIIGIDDKNIYTADTIYYKDGLVATKYTLEGMAYKSYFTHIYDMSLYYKEDGNYTNMW